MRRGGCGGSSAGVQRWQRWVCSPLCHVSRGNPPFLHVLQLREGHCQSITKTFVAMERVLYNDLLVFTSFTCKDFLFLELVCLEAALKSYKRSRNKTTCGSQLINGVQRGYFTG